MAGSLFSNVVVSFFLNTKQAMSALGNLQSSFASTATKMMGTFGGLIGLKGLHGYYNELVKIVQLSEKWNLPIEDMSKFMNLFSQFGGDAEEAAGTIDRLQKLANQLSLHSDGAFKQLSAMIGVNLANKDYKAVIETLRGAYKGLANSPNRNAQTDLAEMIGGDNPALLRMLRASDAEYKQLLSDASKMRVLSKDTADNLTGMDKSLARVRQRWMNISAVAAEAFKPFVDVADRVSVWIEKLPNDVVKAGTLITTGLTVLGTKFALTKAGQLFGMGAGAAAKGAGGGLGKLAILGLTVDAFYGLFAGIERAIKGAESLDEILTEMGRHSYTLNIAIKIGEWIGEKLSGLFDNANLSGAALQLLRSSDINGDLSERGKTLSQVKRWLDENPNDKNYSAVLQNYRLAEDAYGRDLRKNAYDRGLIDKKPDAWIGGSSPTNDNRSVTINIYGVDGAEDMMSRLRTLPMNNMSPISWK